MKTILRLAEERHSLRVVADQIGAPTSAALIAEATATILRQYLRDSQLAHSADPQWLGTYHLSASGETSWHGYAQFIVRLAAQLGSRLKLQAEQIIPISTSEYPVPAPRPANSRLNTEKLQSRFGISLPHWQQGVADVLNQLIKK